MEKTIEKLKLINSMIETDTEKYMDYLCDVFTKPNWREVKEVKMENIQLTYKGEIVSIPLNTPESYEGFTCLLRNLVEVFEDLI